MSNSMDDYCEGLIFASLYCLYVEWVSVGMSHGMRNDQTDHCYHSWWSKADVCHVLRKYRLKKNGF